MGCGLRKCVLVGSRRYAVGSVWVESVGLKEEYC